MYHFQRICKLPYRCVPLASSHYRQVLGTKLPFTYAAASEVYENYVTFALHELIVEPSTRPVSECIAIL